MERRYIGLGLGLVALLCVTNTFARNLAFVERGALTARDALATVEANRPKLIARMVDQYRAAMESHGISTDAFQAALWELAPDRLLAASLADSIEEVSTIIGQAVAGPSRADAKDDPGTGANSWIGYSAGNNVASGTGSAVAAGTNNVASGQNSFVGAGTFNAATAQGAFVGGGTSNVANAISALVMGGFDNQATVIDSAVVAGAGNRATGARSVVVGGGYNLASGQWSFVGGGGRQTTNSGGAGTFAEDNVAAGDFSTIGGGLGNRTGIQNTTNGFAATVAGGDSNTASSGSSVVGGGGGNIASGTGSTVAGGGGNTASHLYSAVGGGAFNTASGGWSTVPGGAGNTAFGDSSFAAGANANANYAGCFVWGDRSTTNQVRCDEADRFVVRAEGGVFFFAGFNGTNDQAGYKGVVLPPGAQAWIAASDRAGKDNLAAVDVRDVLGKVAAMPIATWNWKTQDTSIRHMGPMAQDFRAAFGLGETEKGISTIDADGVALAAIQGLNTKLDERLAEQQREIAELRRIVLEMRSAMEIKAAMH